jgi:hypothetical protein
VKREAHAIRNTDLDLITQVLHPGAACGRRKERIRNGHKRLAPSLAVLGSIEPHGLNDRTVLRVNRRSRT